MREPDDTDDVPGGQRNWKTPRVRSHERFSRESRYGLESPFWAGCRDSFPRAAARLALINIARFVRPRTNEPPPKTDGGSLQSAFCEPPAEAPNAADSLDAELLGVGLRFLGLGFRLRLVATAGGKCAENGQHHHNCYELLHTWSSSRRDHAIVSYAPPRGQPLTFRVVVFTR